MKYPSADHHIDTHNREHYPEPIGQDTDRFSFFDRQRIAKARRDKHEALLIELYGERYWENYQYTKTHANYEF